MGAEQVHVDQQSSPQHKIALFRSLFRGREDVYPRRFESRKTGKSGYSPACANEWVRGICEKPRVKCAECDHRRFLPVTDDIVRWHLSGHDDEECRLEPIENRFSPKVLPMSPEWTPPRPWSAGTAKAPPWPSSILRFGHGNRV